MAIRSFFLVVRQDLLKSVLTIRTRIRYLLELTIDFYLVFKKICRKDQFLQIVMFHLFHPIITNYHGMREISWHILIILIIRKWPTIPQNILRTNSWSILILFTANIVVINYKIRTNIIRRLRRKILKITPIRKKRNFFWCV